MGCIAAGWALLLGLGILGSAPAVAQVSEYAVKAAFIYKFSEFVEWPPGSFKSPNSPIAICVLGDNPFGHLLEQMTRGKTFGGRGFAVKQVQDAPAAEACQILFISRSEDRHLSSILTTLGKSAVLTISDTDGFAARGVMIDLFLDGNKVRFAINPAAAARAGLQISSKLLSLAKIVPG